MKTFLSLSCCVVSFGLLASPADSLRLEKKPKVSKSTLLIRTHNMGQFIFSGRIVSPNPVVDFTYQYDRKTWGATLFKAFDMRDRSTGINFALATVRKNIAITKKWTLTPQVGLILEQSKSFADKGSDVAVFFINTYKISPALTAECAVVFFNLAIDPAERDWVNRFRLLHSHGHWDLAASAWHNNKVIDHDNSVYFSSGASLYYSRLKVTDHLLLNAGVNALWMAYTSNPGEYPRDNGLFFTLSGLIH